MVGSSVKEQCYPDEVSTNFMTRTPRRRAARLAVEASDQVVDRIHVDRSAKVIGHEASDDLRLGDSLPGRLRAEGIVRFDLEIELQSLHESEYAPAARRIHQLD
jgi:hypothetical protein